MQDQRTDLRTDGMLAGVLSRHVSPATVSVRQWTALLAESRAAQLAGQLAEVVLAHPESHDLDPHLLTQLHSAKRVADGHDRAMRWELNRLGYVFERLALQPVLLKGAAYCLDGRVAAVGRQYGDVDLLVPEARLEEVQAALRFAGYGPRKSTAYEQHYYLTWMHEIPPMQHLHRGTTLDVHFRLIPRTSRIAIDHQPLLAGVRPVAADPRLAVLEPAAMVLHSMLHLYTESEFPQGFRNLLDIHLLLCEFSTLPGFARRLQRLAKAAGALGVLIETEAWRQRAFGDVHPGGVAWGRCIDDGFIGTAGPFRDSQTLSMQALSTDLISLALNPSAAREERWSRRVALAALYLRGHWLRMPLRLLVPHLWHQARVRLKRDRQAAVDG